MMERFVEAMARYSLVVVAVVAVALILFGVLLLCCPRLLRLVLRYCGGAACIAAGTGLLGSLIAALWKSRRP